MPEERSFGDMFKDGLKKDVKNRVKDTVIHDSHASDDSHVFDRMADVMYGMTTKMPLFGKYVKTPLDKIDALNKTKIFTSKTFKPIFPFFKVDKKYTKLLVDEAPNSDSQKSVKKTPEVDSQKPVQKVAEVDLEKSVDEVVKNDLEDVNRAF